MTGTAAHLYTMGLPAKRPNVQAVERLHVTGRPPYPRAHVGGVAAQTRKGPPAGLGNRLHVTGWPPYPRAHVGGLAGPYRKGWADVSPALDLVYGLSTARRPKQASLRKPVSAIVLSLDFPVQYAGLRAWYHGAANDLCMVSVADAPSGMGGVLKVDKNGVTYAAYIVETSDTYASPIRVQTQAGIKAVRQKTS